jgi:hypothetical protein
MVREEPARCKPNSSTFPAEGKSLDSLVLRGENFGGKQTATENYLLPADGCLLPAARFNSPCADISPDITFGRKDISPVLS